MSRELKRLKAEQRTRELTPLNKKPKTLLAEVSDLAMKLGKVLRAQKALVREMKNRLARHAKKSKRRQRRLAQKRRRLRQRLRRRQRYRLPAVVEESKALTPDELTKWLTEMSG